MLLEATSCNCCHLPMTLLTLISGAALPCLVQSTVELWLMHLPQVCFFYELTVSLGHLSVCKQTDYQSQQSSWCSCAQWGKLHVHIPLRSVHRHWSFGILSCISGVGDASPSSRASSSKGVSGVKLTASHLSSCFDRHGRLTACFPALMLLTCQHDNPNI